MSIGELIVRTLAACRPLIPGVITVIIATVLAMLYIYFSGRHAWLKSKRFSLPSLFFGLDTRGVISISCAWLKLIFPIVYIVSFEKLVLIQYMMVLIPGLVMVVCAGGFGPGLAALLNLILELVGILSASLICGYITEMRAGSGFLLIYIAIGIFLILYSIYQFIQDLENISGTRTVKADQIWRNAEDGEEFE